MKKAPKLSILIPVYNVEPFLPLCLESVKNQTYKNFECILINDGSTDNSLNVIKKYAKDDKRFNIIDKKNSGYGASLNAGLKIAKGEYISIVEPDDFLNTKFLEKLLRNDGNDIIKCSFINFFGKTWKTAPENVFHELRKGFPVNGTKIDPRKNQKIFLSDPSIWSAIYKREMLEKNHIYFLETPGASYQDISFQFKAFASARTIFCMKDPLYYYRRDNDSASVKSKEKINAVKAEFDEVDAFIDEELRNIANCCRFRSYNWNINRLKFKDAIKFAKTIGSDYKKSGFDANFFRKDGEKRAHELKIGTKYPTLYVFLRPFYKIKNSLKGTIRSIIKTKK